MHSRNPRPQAYFLRRSFARKNLLNSYPYLAAQKAMGEAFLRCWTRKEAYIKAIGDGMRSPLNQFRVSLSGEVPAKFVHIGHSSELASLWTLHHIDPAPGYIGAIAYCGALKVKS